MDKQVRKVGDSYPPLVFEDPPGVPLDLSDIKVTFDFIPESKRAKKKLNVSLKVLDAKKGVVKAPRPRTPGVGKVTLHFQDGRCETLLTTLQWIRDLDTGQLF